MSNENENAFVAKLIKAKRESQSGGISGCRNLCKFTFRLTLRPDSMLVIDLQKKEIETCSLLICIICPVCLVKGFNQKGETFHSLSNRLAR